jgi:hypothetical protein
MTVVTFDDFNSSDLEFRPQDPIYTINYNDSKELLDWLSVEFDNRLKQSESRMRYYRRNMALYKGTHYRNFDVRSDRRDSTDQDVRKPKVVNNFIQEMLDAKVSARSQSKPSITVMPQTDDWKDKVNSRGIELLVKHRYEQENIDDIYSDADRVMLTFGDQFTFCEWNKELGPYHPMYKKMLDENADAKLKNGKKLKDVEVRVGDVEHVVRGPDEVFPQLGKKRWKDIEDIMYVEYVSVAKLKKDYPKLADKIEATQGSFKYDYELMQYQWLQNEAVVIHYFHKKMKHLKEGLEVIYTPDVILEKRVLRYDHGQLPCVRNSDIDIYGEIFGRSFIQNIVQMQRQHNNLSSGVARNHGIGSAPKWMVPKGSAKISDLNNEFSVVEYTGPLAPSIAKFNPTPPEVFNYMKELESQIEKKAAVHGTSRGEPPAGITAAVALQYLDEQEQRRDSRDIAKRYTYIRDLFKMSAQVMAQFYKESDGRTVRILGEDNEYMIKCLKDVDFSVMYDVVVQNASSLPDSKAGKLQAIIDLNLATNTAPEGPVFSRGEIIQMLDLGLDSAFKEQSSIGVKNADSVIDSILGGEPVSEPQIWDDFLVQYPIFIRTLQERKFKEKVEPEIQGKMIEYITTMEGLMWERSTKNMVFAQKLQQFDNFPLFFEVPLPPEPMPMPEMEEKPKPKSKNQEVDTKTLTGQEISEENK